MEMDSHGISDMEIGSWSLCTDSPTQQRCLLWNANNVGKRQQMEFMTESIHLFNFKIRKLKNII
jgi:hypothetical protein